MIKLGISGIPVKKLQNKLNQIGYNLLEDGIFGQDTLKAVLEFQFKKGILVDGIVGPSTMAEIDSELIIKDQGKEDILPSDMKIELHESVLALGTEGFPFGNNRLDVRLPHWPGYNSGVSIGIGFDIGAYGITRNQLDKFFGAIGVPEEMIEHLKETVHITGKPAEKLLADLQLRKRVKLTQQQALDILIVIKQNTSSYVRRAFSQSYAFLHPCIIEALNKIAYGAPALLTGWSNQYFKGLGPMFDKDLTQIKDPVEQFNFFIERMMVSMRNHPWPSEAVKELHGERITEGMSHFISMVKRIHLSGGSVSIKKGLIEISELLEADNKTLEFAAEVASHTHNQILSAEYLRKNLSVYKSTEAKEMKTLCLSNGYISIPNFSSYLNRDMMNICYQVFNPGKSFDVLRAQEILLRLGYFVSSIIVKSYNTSNVDGILGSSTQEALKKYQKRNWIEQTGSLDEITFNLLMNEQ